MLLLERKIRLVKCYLSQLKLFKPHRNPVIDEKNLIAREIRLLVLLFIRVSVRSRFEIFVFQFSKQFFCSPTLERSLSKVFVNKNDYNPKVDLLFIFFKCEPIEMRGTCVRIWGVVGYSLPLCPPRPPSVSVSHLPHSTMGFEVGIAQF